MKKTLIAIFLLLTTAVTGKMTSGQQAQTLSTNYFFSAESFPPFNAQEGGQNTYQTHPEFNGIISNTITISTPNTADGYIFTAPFSQGNEIPPAITILDNSGEPIYIKAIPLDKSAGDFKKQTVDGIDYLTYHSGIQPGGYTFGTSYVMNDSYQVIDTWTIDIGEGSDIHDFLLLDNGHAILMAYVPIPFDLSPYGGPVNGSLIDIVLQEQDANKNIVFEWHASQHMPIEDSEAPLNSPDPIDYLHTNAIEVDNDGNWLLSHRHFSEVTKIDRQTGDIIWRMGGKGNEFTFTNDIGFRNQHDIRRLENGNISLFDNGNQHNPAHSRAVEYVINELSKTVTRVWQYPEDTSIYASAMGNFQRLPNGNSFIGWGTIPQITEVQSDGSVAFEMIISTLNYRAFRFPWTAAPADPPRAVLQYDADPTAVTIYTSWNGATDITGYDIYAGPTTATMPVAGSTPRTGFETTLMMNSLPPNTCFFQTKPIHAQGNPTPFSNMMFRVDIPVCWDQLNHSYMPIFAK